MAFVPLANFKNILKISKFLIGHTRRQNNYAMDLERYPFKSEYPNNQNGKGNDTNASRIKNAGNKKYQGCDLILMKKILNADYEDFFKD